MPQCFDCRFWWGTKDEGCHRYPIMHRRYCTDMSCGEFQPHRKNLKSAVEGLFKFHEDRIEELIKEWRNNKYRLDELYEFDMIVKIEQHYESIMAIEHWLEDVI